MGRNRIEKEGKEKENPGGPKAAREGGTGFNDQRAFL